MACVCLRRLTEIHVCQNAVPAGTFVTLCIENVPEEYYAKIAAAHVPLVVFFLLRHENLMSVSHFRIKTVPSWTEPIKCVRYF